MARRTVWLLRHAKTVPDPPEGGTDFDRVLAVRGRRDAKALGTLIEADGHKLGLGTLRLPEVVLVSPAARTAATADLALAHLEPAPEVRAVRALYSADPDEVIDELRALEDGVRSVMVIGHNPTMEALGLELVTRKDVHGRATMERGFPTCGLAVYDVTIREWKELDFRSARLVGMLTPPFATS
ncbi:MAG TPA: hypothetical protein VL961_08595 [Acidimicrobiales bacterium]|nr:hypothetical protein [Acidimicrobiales bacterium]